MKALWNKHRKDISALLAIALAYGIFHLVGIGCPIKFFTGVSCAGCGMTRAWWYLLHGNLKLAVYYHPLFWLPLCATFVILLRKRLSKNIYYGCIIGMCVLALAVYLYRFSLPHQHVVVFQPQDGFFVRVFRAMLGK
ncbi:MAG: DUF2752 domain-containing protein [Lachnospiraceae bacterium]|nr:DUF2752 domain-containing protein [Lachnospiraceae bacterium]